MQRYKKLFNHLNIISEGCFIPFIVLGDPNIEVSLRIVDTLVSSGIDALEVGIPFSDPMADGIVIQEANLRSFSSGITVLKCFDMLSKIRKKYNSLPIGILTYANLIFQQGIENFYNNCKKIEIDSVLIADVPIQEYEPFFQACKLNKIDPIFMCPPDTNNNLIKLISSYESPYIYLLSRAGVTGIQKNINLKNKNLIKNIKKNTTIPIVQGFGIYTSKQIKKIISNGATGVICGSVIIKIIENNKNNEIIMMKKIRKIVTNFKRATFIKSK
ncbi:Tryptophan synthase alpha chain [Buchnera aphidicola (Tetraneura ulmi)]|uniref:tryptophan synthase subunit alpha n=1 Tax=Buchnera aphidicola TaxID=9 RepID=UPI003463C603